MTYREYRKASDRAFLSMLLEQHGSITASSKAAGMSRHSFYRIARRCGFTWATLPSANRGNAQWQELAESREAQLEKIVNTRRAEQSQAISRMRSL